MGMTRNPSIESRWRDCRVCGKQTEHRGYVVNTCIQFQCLACAARRGRERYRRQQPTVQPNSPISCDLDLQPGETVCTKCFLTTCDCKEK